MLIDVDRWAHRSSFVNYIENLSYNDLNVVPDQYCRSTLAQHSVYRLKTVLYECWGMSAPIIIRQIYWELFLQWFEWCARSALQHNTSTTLRLSFPPVSFFIYAIFRIIKYRKSTFQTRAGTIRSAADTIRIRYGPCRYDTYSIRNTCT